MTLKPCPFCGGDAERKDERREIAGRPHTRHVVGCPERREGWEGRAGCGARTRWYPTAKEAAAAWNRRQPDASPPTLLEAEDADAA